MRKLHRWVSLPAFIFLLVVAVTGVILQCTSFFGEDEAERERLAAIKSTQMASAPVAGVQEQVDRALAAARAGVGIDVPVDALEMQLKDSPRKIVVWTAAGGGAKKDEPLKITVNAETGLVIRTESGERESFILRLHTGEVFGDGGVVLGMVWGTALLVLTLTGGWMYLRMWRARRRSLNAAAARGATGVKKPRFGGAFWMIALGAGLAALTPRAHAGPPFLTDDPGFADKGWELKSLVQYEHHKDGPDVLVGPTLDINYTVVSNFKFNITFAEKSLFGKDGAKDEFGLADTDAKFKWRFVEEDQSGWRPAVSTAPTLTVPTGDEGRGLGDGVFKWKLPFQVGKTFGEEHRWFTYAEAGFSKKLDGSGGDGEIAILGAVVGRNLTDHLQLGAELYTEHPLGGSGRVNQILNFGATYIFNEHWNVQLGIGTSISDNDGPDPIVQFLLQWNF